MTTYTTDSHVATIASENPSTIAVFERRGLDFCCGGKRPLAAACDELGLSAEQILMELEEAMARPAPETHWGSVPLPTLIDHILDRYHAVLRRDLPTIGSLAERVASRHGDRAPALRRVGAVVRALSEELTSHMAKEERVLFPLIARLAAGDGQPLQIDGPVQAMEHEHDEVGEMLAELRDLTAGFAPPADACNSHRGLLHMLAELERDTHVHIHLENNVLFPRAQQLASGA